MTSTSAAPAPEAPPAPRRPATIQSILFLGGHVRILQEGEVAHVIESEAGPICVNIFKDDRPLYSIPYHAIEMMIFDEYDDDGE